MSAVESEPIDFAAIKAEHPRETDHFGGPDYCDTCSEDEFAVRWPCLVYRLAVEVERLAGKVARVEVLAEDVLHGRHLGTYGTILAALADQPEPHCPCDGGSYGVKTHPFLVHPECPTHALADQPEQVQP